MILGIATLEVTSKQHENFTIAVDSNLIQTASCRSYQVYLPEPQTPNHQRNLMEEHIHLANHIHKTQTRHRALNPITKPHSLRPPFQTNSIPGTTIPNQIHLTIRLPPSPSPPSHGRRTSPALIMSTNTASSTESWVVQMVTAVTKPPPCHRRSLHHWGASMMAIAGNHLPGVADVAR